MGSNRCVDSLEKYILHTPVRTIDCRWRSRASWRLLVRYDRSLPKKICLCIRCREICIQWEEANNLSIHSCVCFFHEDVYFNAFRNMFVFIVWKDNVQTVFFLLYHFKMDHNWLRDAHEKCPWRIIAQTNNYKNLKE